MKQNELEGRVASRAQNQELPSGVEQGVSSSILRSSKSSVLIVIRAYNEARFLRELLEMLRQIHFLVVDDGSSFGLGEFACREAFENAIPLACGFP